MLKVASLILPQSMAETPDGPGLEFCLGKLVLIPQMHWERHQLFQNYQGLNLGRLLGSRTASLILGSMSKVLVLTSSVRAFVPLLLLLVVLVLGPVSSGFYLGPPATQAWYMLERVHNLDTVCRRCVELQNDCTSRNTKFQTTSRSC